MQLSDRQELLERFFYNIWHDKPEGGNELINETLLALLNMLCHQGYDFSQLKGSADLTMWIAHKIDDSYDFTSESSYTLQAFKDTFPEINIKRKKPKEKKDELRRGKKAKRNAGRNRGDLSGSAEAG